jgi:hypothetical protein
MIQHLQLTGKTKCGEITFSLDRIKEHVQLSNSGKKGCRPYYGVETELEIGVYGLQFKILARWPPAKEKRKFPIRDRNMAEGKFSMVAALSPVLFRYDTAALSGASVHLIHICMSLV